MAATWQRLGDAAGTKGVGVNRIRIDSGKLPTPPHGHARSEEIYFVLDGSGLAWQDEEVCEVRAGDTIVQVADHYEHTFRAGPDGLDLLAFGTRHPVEYGWLPRSRAQRFGYLWVEGRTDDPWDIETELGEVEFAAAGERPPNVVHLDDVEVDKDGDRAISAEAGSEQTGLNWVRRAPGHEVAVPHSHSLEEEVFVVLEGGCTLELWPTPIAADRGAEKEAHELRAGHVVARPPGTRIAHCFRAAPEGVTMLVYGTREPNDICFYPRSSKVYFRGAGLIARLEHLDYWDGEPPL